MSTTLATFSFQVAPEQSGAAPEWVHLLPAGKFSGRDGRGPYVVQDTAALIAASMAEGDRVLDFDHATVHRERGSGRAAGWIKAMEAREDGIWGRVEWTRKGSEALADREYRFISPVFRHDKSGRVARIEHASLVNDPNLQLQAVASRDPDALPNQPGEPGMDLLAKLVTLFGLPAGSDEAKVEAHARSLVEGQAAHVAELKTIADAIGLKGEPKADAIAAHAKTSLTTGAADPSQFVPMAQFQELRNQLGELTAQSAKDAAERSVNAAITAGKVTPAQKDWALAYASKDPEGFAGYVDKAPVIVQPGKTTHAAGDPPGGGGKRQLDDNDRAICANLGLSEEAYLAAMTQESR